MRIFSKYHSILSMLLLLALFAPVEVLAQAKEPWEGAYTSPQFAGGAIRNVYCDLVGEVEGSFGALAFIVGGIMTFAYAVFGDTKKSYAIVMAGIIGATMSTGISLYFGKMCGDNGGGNGTARTAKNSTYYESNDSEQLDIPKLDFDQDEGLF